VLLALKAINKGTVSSEIALLVLKVTGYYIPERVNERIWEWEKNNWKTALGGQLAKEEMWRKIHGVCKELEGKGVEVKFWEVDENKNRMAEKLAKTAFEKEDK